MVPEGADGQGHVPAGGLHEVQGCGVGPVVGQHGDQVPVGYGGVADQAGEQGDAGAARPATARWAPPSTATTCGGAGWPPWLADHLVEIQTLALTRPEAPNDTVEQVTGHAARTVDDFLADHLHRFTRPAPAPATR